MDNQIRPSLKKEIIVHGYWSFEVVEAFSLKLSGTFKRKRREFFLRPLQVNSAYFIFNPILFYSAQRFP